MPKLKPTIAIGTIGYSPLIQLKTLPHIVALQPVFAICRICISNCNLTHSFGKIKIIYICQWLSCEWQMREAVDTN